MPLIQAVYLSSLKASLADEELDEIIRKSDVSNRARGVTGMLLAHDGSVIQVLEGEAEVVDALLDRIERDPRHHGILRLLRSEIEEREFPAWGMGRVEDARVDATEVERIATQADAAPKKARTRARKLLNTFALKAR